MRMVVMVLSYLAPIHKGVQAAHAVADYMHVHGSLDDTKAWVEKERTLIMLDVGNSPEMDEFVGFLEDLVIPFAEFRENEMMSGLNTAIAFIHKPGENAIIDMLVKSKGLAR